MMKFVTIVVLCISVTALTPTFYWDIGYVDNIEFEGRGRRAIGVNGVWPPPSIEASVDDILQIVVRNSLDVPTSLHHHGLFQNGSQFMDGAVGITNCPIPPGSNFTYKVPVKQHGTTFIHAHYMGQYVDGLRTPLVLRPAKEAYAYDEEITVSLSDWYFKEHPELMDFFFSIYNPNGLEPVPDVALINHKTDESFVFKAGKTYRLRFVNMSAFAMFNVFIDGHDMTVIEVDGVDTNPHTIDAFAISAAQRYSVLVTAKNDTTANFNLNVHVDTAMFGIPSNIKTLLTVPIIYNPSLAIPPGSNEIKEGARILEDLDLKPLNAFTPFTSTSINSIPLDINFAVFDDGKNHGSFNDQAFQTPHLTPTILTAQTLQGDEKTSAELYGNARAIPLEHLSVVELVMSNFDTGSHPFHLHGHVFQIISRGVIPYDASKLVVSNSSNPVRRDTVQIPSMEYVVLRFIADNPGVWLEHCHIEWHLESGLAVTFIEAPELITTKAPKEVLEQCGMGGFPISGNANGKPGRDMKGFSIVAQPITMGVGLKGWVGLGLCVFSAFIGIAGVIWFSKEE